MPQHRCHGAPSEPGVGSGPVGLLRRTGRCVLGSARHLARAKDRSVTGSHGNLGADQKLHGVLGRPNRTPFKPLKPLEAVAKFCSVQRVPQSPDAKPSDHADLVELQRPLEIFRAKRRKPRIHPVELVLLWVITTHLVFLPWALGGMRAWAQWISLGLATAGMLVALLPRNSEEASHDSVASGSIVRIRLLRFPVFWIGLALVLLVTVQASNASWAFKTNGKTWWMQAIPHLGWLPSGVEAPFERGGPWRTLIVYITAWLTICSIWVGFTRRRTIQVLFVGLAVNGLLLAIFGLAQRVAGNGKIFWLFESPNPTFFSSFIYKNHGGAYLVLTLAIACGLTGWYYLRGQRRLDKSNPSGVLAFLATCIAVSILTSYARGATITMLAFLIVCIGAFVIHQLRQPKGGRTPVVTLVLVIIFGFFLKTGLEALQSREAWDRLKQGISHQDSSLASRALATKAATEMWRDYALAGAGAGSFRFLFPVYQNRFPELVVRDGRPMYWEHAHNDLVEFPIELGVTGIALLLAAGAYWVVALLRSSFWLNPLAASAALGALLVLVYAWWDFPFQCPAILVTWCALWPAVSHWSRLEDHNPST